MAKTQEEQMIADAVKGTEVEIFKDAIGEELPDTEAGEQGDRSVEEMGEGLEGQIEDEESAEDDAGGADDSDAEAGDDAGDDDEEAGTADDGDDQERDPKTGQFKPKADAKGDGKSDKVEKPGAVDPKTGKAPKAGADDPEGKGRVPSGRLREETSKREQAERQRDEALSRVTKIETEFGALNQRLDGLLTAIATGQVKPGAGQQPQQQAQEEQAPDIFVDPEGYQRFMERRVAAAAASGHQAVDSLRVEMSMANAHDRHGEAFEKAYGTLTSLDKRDPNAQALVRRIWSSPNPGKALMTWHQQQETLREVGQDPSKYREKVQTETREQLLNDPDFIKQVMDKMRESAGGNGGPGTKPRTVIRTNTPSLNSARGGGMGQLPDRRPQDNSDASVFDYALNDE